jgi:hypothetical protein
MGPLFKRRVAQRQKPMTRLRAETGPRVGWDESRGPEATIVAGLGGAFCL